MPNTRTWQSFEGLSKITDPFERQVAISLLQKELGSLSNGYMISHAELGNSGYSFGGSQMDLSVSNMREF